jgi:hypothetical protein
MVRPGTTRAAALFGTVLCAALCAVAPPAAAWCRTTTCSASDECVRDDDGCLRGGKPLAWAGACVSFSLHVGAPPAGLDRDQVARILEDAFGRWTNVDCGGTQPSIALAPTDHPSQCGRPDYSAEGGNANVWMFRHSQWPYAATALAVTIVTFDADTGAILDADVELNAAAGLAAGQTPDGYDLESIVQHEAGHFLGLSHSAVRDATMWRRIARGTTEARTLAADDAAGICNAYPPTRTLAACDFAPRNRFSAQCSDDPRCAMAPPSPAAPKPWWLGGLVLGFLRRARIARRVAQAGKLALSMAYEGFRMLRIKATRAAAAVVLSVLFPGCSGGGGGGGGILCADAGTCPPGQHCASGMCVADGGNGGQAGSSAGGNAGSAGFAGGAGSSGGSGFAGGGASGSAGSANGGDCLDAAECSGEVCSPTTQKCGPGDCAAPGWSCPSTSQICGLQWSGASEGACYSVCTPFTTGGCAPGWSCASISLDNSVAVCFVDGSASEGQPCKALDLSTGCSPGLYCANDVCRKLCDYWSASPGCGSSQQCVIGGICSPSVTGDAAQVGGSCAISAAAGDNCGNDGEAWRGSCQADGSGTLQCAKFCRTQLATDCPSGTTCFAFGNYPEIGVCM